MFSIKNDFSVSFATFVLIPFGLDTYFAHLTNSFFYQKNKYSGKRIVRGVFRTEKEINGKRKLGRFSVRYAVIKKALYIYVWQYGAGEITHTSFVCTQRNDPALDIHFVYCCTFSGGVCMSPREKLKERALFSLSFPFHIFRSRYSCHSRRLALCRDFQK